MVLFGGLEIVAAGYLIHKHQQNKKDRARLEEEAAALEEEQYRIFPPEREDRKHRRSRSSSRGREHRHSHDRHERRHSYDRNDRKPRRESSMPLSPQMRPQQYPNPNMSAPSLVSQQIRPQAPSTMPPPQYDPSTAPARPAQEVKYGWTDEPAQQPRPQDPNYPPTGWPAHWEQSQTAAVNNNLQPSRQQANSGRSRRERTPESSPHVRFAVPSSSSQRTSPPPTYRP